MCDGDSVQPPETKDRDGAQPRLKPVMFDTPSQDTGQVKGHPWERCQSSRARNVPWVPLPGLFSWRASRMLDLSSPIPEADGDDAAAATRRGTPSSFLSGRLHSALAATRESANRSQSWDAQTWPPSPSRPPPGAT